MTQTPDTAVTIDAATRRTAASLINAADISDAGFTAWVSCWMELKDIPRRDRNSTFTAFDVAKVAAMNVPQMARVERFVEVLRNCGIYLR